MGGEQDTDRILWLVLDANPCVTWIIYRSHRRGSHGSNFRTAVTYSSQSNSKLYVQKINYVPNVSVELPYWQESDYQLILDPRIKLIWFDKSGTRNACSCAPSNGVFSALHSLLARSKQYVSWKTSPLLSCTVILTIIFLFQAIIVYDAAIGTDMRDHWNKAIYLRHKIV